MPRVYVGDFVEVKDVERHRWVKCKVKEPCTIIKGHEYFVCEVVDGPLRYGFPISYAIPVDEVIEKVRPVQEESNERTGKEKGSVV